MVAATRALPPEAARISATPQASDTKNAYSCETPRNLGFTGVGRFSAAGSETVFMHRRYRHKRSFSGGGIRDRRPELGGIHSHVQAGHSDIEAGHTHLEAGG